MIMVLETLTTEPSVPPRQPLNEITNSKHPLVKVYGTLDYEAIWRSYFFEGQAWRGLSSPVDFEAIKYTRID